MLLDRLNELNEQTLLGALGITAFFIVLMAVIWSCARVLAARERRRYELRRAANDGEWRLKEQMWQQERAHWAHQVKDRDDNVQALRERVEAKDCAIRTLEVTLAEQNVRIEEQTSAMRSEIALLSSARASLTQEFENLANRLFNAKQEHFQRSAKSNLEQVMVPFRQQLSDFYQRVDDVHRYDAAQRHQLMGQMSELQKQSQQIGQDAVNLANALKGNNKLQGSWGEVILARILEQSGLVKGREYDTQVSDVNADGKRMQPDVVVHLPNKKDIIIDAKVSLLAYECYANAEDEHERSSALKAHIESLRAHTKGLAGKRYNELPNIRSLDFVFLFVPVEAALSVVVHHAPDLLKSAYENSVVVVSPSSLIVSLRTVEALWQRDKQDRNVEEMVVSAGKLYDQFVRFVESLNDVGACLKKANEAYAMSHRRLYEGRGNLVKRAEQLRQLGAKTSKKMPDGMLRLAEASTIEFDAKTLEE